MLTHSYTRSRSLQSSSTIDAYNRLLECPQGTPREYWTNGTTTHIVSSASPFDTYHSTTAPMASPGPSALPKPKRKRTWAPRQQDTPNKSVVVNSILAGSGAGVISTLFIYPLDVLRTKMQASSSVVPSAANTLAAQTTHCKMGPWQVFRHTLSHGGIRALYTGLGLPLAAQTVYKSTVFTVNNLTQEFILDYKHFENQKLGVWEPVRLTYMDHFICGFLGGAVNAAAFVTPVELIRNQLIAAHTARATAMPSLQTPALPSNRPGSIPPSATTTLHVLRQALASPQGIRSLWRGTSWAVARDGFGCGCFFYSMNWTQHALTPPGERPTFATTLISGGTAGLLFWVACLPLDTVKTWVQSSSLASSSHKPPMEVLRDIHRHGGPQAVVERLFRGWQMAYGRGIPSAAITISVYSWVYATLQDRPLV